MRGAPSKSGTKELETRNAIIETIPLITKTGWGTPQTIAGRVSPRKSGSTPRVLSIEDRHNARSPEDAGDSKEHRPGMRPGHAARQGQDPNHHDGQGRHQG